MAIGLIGVNSFLRLYAFMHTFVLLRGGIWIYGIKRIVMLSAFLFYIINYIRWRRALSDDALMEV